MLAALSIAAALLGILWLQVLAVFICALGTHTIYTGLLRKLDTRLPRRTARVLAVVITVLVLGAIAGAVSEAVEMLAGPGPGMPALLNLLADTLARARSQLPRWASSHLPASTVDLQNSAEAWLRAHAQGLRHWGMNALRLAAHVMIGLIIGLLAAFEAQPRPTSALAAAAARSAHHLQRGFAAVVSAQLRIAVVNTILTAIFLLGALPLAGVHLPLSVVLVALSFCACLIPIVGNLLANAAILLVALTVSPVVAAVALAFLIAVHKLEYFLNAHFVGRGTHVPASWLLASMVAFEAAFGVAGLLAAPIISAWAFAELREANIVS